MSIIVFFLNVLAESYKKLAELSIELLYYFFYNTPNYILPSQLTLNEISR